MARKMTEAALAERDLLDTIRTVVRLKHRIAMRHELNDIEEAAVAAQQDALVNGQPYRLDVAALVQDEVGEVG